MTMNADEIAKRIAENDPWSYIASAYDQAIGQSYDSMLVKICSEFLQIFRWEQSETEQNIGERGHACDPRAGPIQRRRNLKRNEHNY
jgi:hypothetical protein